MATKLKKGDNVIVIAGKDKGKQGEILKIDRKKDKVIVKGINIVTKHQKPNQANQTGGRLNFEAGIHSSNVMYVHNGKATRLGYDVSETEQDGKKIKIKKRVAKSTGEIID